jgi:hypothetical protein
MTTPFLLLTKNEALVAFGQTRKYAKQMKNIQRRDGDALVAAESREGLRRGVETRIRPGPSPLLYMAVWENGFPDFPHMR